MKAAWGWQVAGVKRDRLGLVGKRLPQWLKPREAWELGVSLRVWRDALIRVVLTGTDLR